MVPQRNDVIAGYSCNSRCRFCSQGSLRDRLPDLDDATVRARIAEACATGETVVFTGGEPTLRDELGSWVRLAKELGAQRVEVQTNGRMLSYAGVVSRLSEAGVDAFQIALHGHTAELHEWHTRSEGSFEQAARGIRRAKAHAVPVLVTTVVTRSNYRHLHEIVAFALSLGADGWRASMARPVGNAANELGGLVPRFALVAPVLGRALALMRRVRRPATVKGVPPCVLGGEARNLVDLRPALAEAHVGPEPHLMAEEPLEADRVHGEPCGTCSMAEQCPGVWALYARRYGWDELTPVASQTAAA